MMLRDGLPNRRTDILRPEKPLGGVNPIGLNIVAITSGALEMARKCQHHICLAALHHRHGLSRRLWHPYHIYLGGSVEVGHHTRRQTGVVVVDHGHCHALHVKIGHERKHEHHHKRHTDYHLGNERIAPHHLEFLAQKRPKYSHVHCLSARVLNLRMAAVNTATVMAASTVTSVTT